MYQTMEYGGEEINLMSGTAEAGGQMAGKKKLGMKKPDAKREEKLNMVGFGGKIGHTR